MTEPETNTVQITREELYAYRSLLTAFMTVFANAVHGSKPDMKDMAQLLVLTHVALQTAEDVHGPLNAPETPQNVH